MGIITTSLEFKSSISQSRLFKALATEAHEIAPKASPQLIKSVEISEENGVKVAQTNFTDASPFKMVKHSLDSIDIANYTTKVTLIEGDVLGDRFEKVCYDSKIEASDDGGSILKQILEVHTKGDVEVSDEEIKQGNEQATLLFKATEAYLVANPNACA